MDRPGQTVRTAPKPAERRAHPRVALRAAAAFEDVSGTVFLSTEDLSERGLRLGGPMAPAPPAGAPVRVVLELPHEPELQRLSGRVVRVRRGSRPELAVALDPTPRAAALRRTVERRLADEEAP